MAGKNGRKNGGKKWREKMAGKWREKMARKNGGKKMARENIITELKFEK
jgi:hypothetical protein